MAKQDTINVIKSNVFENTNNEITGQMTQDALVYMTNDTYTQLDTKQNTLVSGTNIKTVNSNSLLGSGNVSITAGSVGAYTKAEVDAIANTKVPKTTTVNDKPLSSNIVLAAGDVGAYTKAETDTKLLTKVDKTTTVNGKALSTNITLTTSDVGALPTTTTYAGSSSVGGAATSANKVNSALTLQLNGTTSSTFDGSVARTFNAQTPLVSGTNIKTINSTTLLGSGNIAVQPTLVSGTNIKTINGVSLIGSGDVSVGAGINVVNTLTSTSTGDALSANQGRILNEKFVATSERIEITYSDILDLDFNGLNASWQNIIKIGNLVTVSFTFDLYGGVTQPTGPTMMFLKTKYKPINNSYGTGLISNTLKNRGIYLSTSTVEPDSVIKFDIFDGNDLGWNSTLYVTGSITYITN